MPALPQMPQMLHMAKMPELAMSASRSSKRTVTREKRRIHIPPDTQDSDGLLTAATQALRCVRAADMTAELLKQNVPGQQVNVKDLHVLAHPANPGEIDRFFSNSWHDDGAIKYAKLETYIRTFTHVYGREPTFWIDKVCIDQDDLSTGLKVLPINLMACKGVLMALGPSYPSRLWCVWELFTLMAFMPMEQVFEKIDVMPLEEGNGESLLRKLQTFDYKHAHCYDPNEEARLKKTIETIGGDSFNARVRELGRKLLLPKKERCSRAISRGSVPRPRVINKSTGPLASRRAKVMP